MAAVAVKHGNSMPPPQLAADAPVLQLAHPGVEAIDPVLWEKFRLAGIYFGNCFFCDICAHEPLLRDVRLDDVFAAVTVADLIFVILDFFDKAQPLKLRYDLIARGKSL